MHQNSTTSIDLWASCSAVKQLFAVFIQRTAVTRLSMSIEYNARITKKVNSKQKYVALNLKILVSFDSAPDADCKNVKILRRSTIPKELQLCRYTPFQ